jgi:hypothetical protein
MSLPTNFDYKIYLEINPDILNHGINTEELAIQHYIEYGQKENRGYCYDVDLFLNKSKEELYQLLPDNFDYKLYLEMNPDISKHGITTEESAIKHYIEYGQKENRLYQKNKKNKKKKIVLN